jgi:hypothetical protein
MADNPLTPIGMAIQAEIEEITAQVVDACQINPRLRKSPAHDHDSHQADAVPYLLHGFARRSGKSAILDKLKHDYLRKHPGAKVATFKNGVYKCTDAGGELIKDPADGVYKPAIDMEKQKS